MDKATAQVAQKLCMMGSAADDVNRGDPEFRLEHALVNDTSLSSQKMLYVS